MPSITLTNLSVGYLRPRRTPLAVLTGLNATLHSGRLTCLVGANGIGKSTLLRTLAAFLPPLDGQILYRSSEDAVPVNLSSLSKNRMARLVSVVLTAKPSVENLTAEQVVALGRSPYTNLWGTLRAADLQKVQWAMHAVGILPLQKRMVHTLSDGERQKVMIAKALAQDTPVMLLDEPTAFLDYHSKVEMLRLLHTLAHQTNKMLLLSTHDLEQALYAADALWVVARTQQQAPATLRVMNKQQQTDHEGNTNIVFLPEAPDDKSPMPVITIGTPTDFERRTHDVLRLLGEA